MYIDIVFCTTVIKLLSMIFLLILQSIYLILSSDWLFFLIWVRTCAQKLYHCMAWRTVVNNSIIYWTCVNLFIFTLLQLYKKARRLGYADSDIAAVYRAASSWNLQTILTNKKAKTKFMLSWIDSPK